MEGTGEDSVVSRREFVRGAAGASAVAGASGVAGAQEGNGTDGTQNEERQVEMTDQLVFDPEEITVAPGDTVVWVNVGQVGHSVTAYEDEIPADAEYFASGGFDGEQAARQNYPQQGNVAGGEEYRHTFEVPGSYGYFCIPHESVGMVGTVDVVEGGGGGEGEAAAGPVLPDAARTIGIATTGALASVLALAYFFMKYGGDYGDKVEE